MGGLGLKSKQRTLPSSDGRIPSCTFLTESVANRAGKVSNTRDPLATFKGIPRPIPIERGSERAATSWFSISLVYGV